MTAREQPAPALPSPSTPSRRPWLRFVVGAAGYLAIVGLAWRAIDHDRFVEGISRVTPAQLALVLGVALLHIAGRALRFHWLVQRCAPKDYGFFSGVQIFLVGLSASAVTPGRVGDFIKARLVRRYGIGFNVGLGIVLVERMLDLLVIVSSIVVTGAILSGRSGSQGWRAAAIVLLVGLVGGVVVISTKAVRHPCIALAARLVAAVKKSVDREDLVAKLDGMFQVWDTVFASPLTLARYLFWSVLVWVAEFLKLWLVLRFVGVAVDPEVTMFVYPTSIVAGILTLLPFSEGVIGVTSATLLHSIAGVDIGFATVAVVIDRAASTLPPMLLWAVLALAGLRSRATSARGSR